MIAFPEMLVEAAERAGMKVPKNIDKKWSIHEFVHWTVFCNMQLGAGVPYHGCHWDNAKIIADIPEVELKKMTFNDLLRKGFQIST